MDVAVSYDAPGTLIPGYEDLPVSGTSVLVSGISLCQSSVYYRVRATDGATTSSNSNVVTVSQFPLQQYRSAGSGSWSDPASWEQYDGASWIPAAAVPDAATRICANDAVLIRPGHQITLSGLYAFPEITIEAGGALTLADGAQLTVAESFTVPGTLKLTNTAVVAGTGDFTLAAGAHLWVGSPDGIAISGAAGSIQLAGTRTFAQGASYTYSGAGNQLTGTGLTQNTPLHVVINSPGNTVALSAPLTLSGDLSITGGTLDANGFNLTVGGNWTSSGTFQHGTSTVEFNGNGSGTIGASSFHHILFSGAGTKAAAGNLLIEGNLTIADNFDAGTFTHTLQGHWINNGVFAANSSVIRFINTIADQTISGTANAGNNTFYGLEVEKGTTDKILEVIAPIGLAATANNSLIITSGTFKLSHPSLIYPFNNGTQATIPSNGGFWNNGGTITAGSFSWILYGKLTVSAGTVNIGINAGNSLRYYTGSVISVEGGELNVAGRISWSTFPGPESVTYIQNGGTVRLVTSGSASTSLAALDIAAPGSVFQMSGGTIVFQRATSNQVECLNLAATHSVTGGVWQFGDHLTPAGVTFRINSTVPLWDLVIHNLNTPTLGISTNNLVVLNDVTIGGVLDAEGRDIFVGGHWTNNGTFTSGTGKVVFQGSSTQTIGGSGSTVFHDLKIDNGTGVSISIDQVVTSTLDLTDGTLSTGAQRLTVGSGGNILNAGATSYVNGILARIYPTTGSLSFPVGKDGTFQPASVEYTALSGTSTVAVECFSTGFPGTSPSAVTQVGTRFWNITQTGGSSFTYNVTLDGSGLIFPGGPVILKYDAPNTALYQTTSPNYTATGLTSFSDFGLGSCAKPTFAYTTSDISCFNGSDGTITINASGGSGSGYEYSINGGSTWHATHQFTGLISGNYILQVKDGNGCVQINGTIP